MNWVNKVVNRADQWKRKSCGSRQWLQCDCKWMKVSDRMTLQRTSPISWIRWTRAKKWGTLLDASIFIPSNIRQTQTITLLEHPPLPQAVYVFLQEAQTCRGVCVSTRQDRMQDGWLVSVLRLAFYWCSSEAATEDSMQSPKIALVSALLYQPDQYIQHGDWNKLYHWCIRHQVNWLGTFWKNIVSAINGDWIKPSLDIIPFLRYFYFSSFPFSSSWPSFLLTFLSLLLFSCQCCNLPVPRAFLSPGSASC